MSSNLKVVVDHREQSVLDKIILAFLLYFVLIEGAEIYFHQLAWALNIIVIFSFHAIGIRSEKYHLFVSRVNFISIDRKCFPVDYKALKTWYLF